MSVSETTVPADVNIEGQEDQPKKQERNLNGLGGWLVLVGLGLIISPFRMLMEVYPLYSEIFIDGGIEVLTSPESSYYHPFWAPYLYSEVAINLGVFICSVYLIYLFFSKKSLFPKVFIWLLVASLAFVILDALVPSLLMPSLDVFDGDTVREIIRAFIGVGIWVPYMLVSKRVKQTFIR